MKSNPEKPGENTHPSVRAKPNTKHPRAKHEASTILELLRSVGRKAGVVPDLPQLVEHITKMTQQTLNAEASSVLLLDDREGKFRFEVVEGQAKKHLKQLQFSADSGIAGWVAHHGTPVIVNNVAQDTRFNRTVDKTTGFVTESIVCAPLVIQRKVIGVVEVLNKKDGGTFTEQDKEVLVSVASTTAISIENIRLHQNLLSTYKSTISALAAAIDAKDHYTRGHSQRVMDYALLAGKSLLSSATEIEDLEYAGILHDIGKIGIADSILSKPGPLNPEEWQIMRQHSAIGANILEEIPFLEGSRRFILHHHERYDGKGYPDGLKGEDIPAGARLLAVADAFDTMTTDRAYRRAGTVEHAIDELLHCSGTQFCPVSVEAFVSGLQTAGKA